MLSKLYRRIIPSAIRAFIYRNFLKQLLGFIRNFRMNLRCKTVYCFRFLYPRTEYYDALAFLGRYGLSAYPGAYRFDYRHLDVDIAWDEARKMHFVMHHGKKLYFTPAFDREQIIRLYKSLVTEQDIRSPHRYATDPEELRGYTLLDIGSAEGIFTLDHIELIEHAYLFEVEAYWIEALKATFEPWKEKISIIENYVGDKSSGNVIRIDDFLQDKTKENLYVKMDIEGAEMSALQGAFTTLSHGKNIRVAVCTYHRPGDPENIGNFLKGMGYQIEFSKGFLFWGKRLSKALIRAIKTA